VDASVDKNAQKKNFFFTNLLPEVHNSWI